MSGLYCPHGWQKWPADQKKDGSHGINRIICIGNSAFELDQAGPEAFIYLKEKKLPPHVELVDGGLKGIDLLYLIDGCEKIVFIDNVTGFGNPGEVVVIHGTDAAELAGPAFEHDAGLPYLLKVLPLVSDHRIPEVRIIGIETPYQPDAVIEASHMALSFFDVNNDSLWIDYHTPSEVNHDIYGS